MAKFRLPMSFFGDWMTEKQGDTAVGFVDDFVRSTKRNTTKTGGFLTKCKCGMSATFWSDEKVSFVCSKCNEPRYFYVITDRKLFFSSKTLWLEPSFIQALFRA